MIIPVFTRSRVASLIESVIHMLMCGLGGSIVALHVGYMKCGVFGAMPINILLSAIVGYCVCTLVWSAQKLYGRVQMHELTYPDVIEAAMLLSPCRVFRKVSRISRYLVEITLLCHLYGTCCVYIVMIARNLKELGTGYGTVLDDDDDPPVKVIVLWLIVPCLIICMVTDMKCFAPFALICDLFGVALILVTLWYTLHDIDQNRGNPGTILKSIPGMVEFCCICVFALDPVSHALPIENSMKHPKRFHFVILTAMPILTVAMMTVGFFGYWYYGEYSVVPITVHFPCSPFAVTVKVFLCISLSVVYALCFYLGFDLVWYYLRRKHDLSQYWFWERFYRALHVVTLVLITCGVPIDIVRIMGLIGAMCTTPVIFIYPPLIHLLVNWEHPGLGRCRFRLVSSICIMLLGFLLTVAGTYYNMVGILTESSQNSMEQYKSNIQKKETFWGRSSSNLDLNVTDLKFNLISNSDGYLIKDYKSMLSNNITVLKNFTK